jgi:DNA-binding CsgD family transcriptional regulator
MRLNALKNILANLRWAKDLKTGEAALVAVSEVLQLHLAYWVPDTSHPYVLPEMVSFARACGWPDELLKLWWNRHGALKMPLYIRCRFEHLPFIVSPSDKRDGTARVSPEQARATDLIGKMGVTTFLVVPLHLPKGQVAIIVWAGNRHWRDIHNVVADLEGDLLEIAFHFMRIASRPMEREIASNFDQSRLTAREWDCMRTLAQGYHDAEIAELAGISKPTVRYHLDNVVQKFGCRTRVQAVALLAQLGLIGEIGQ